MTPMEMKAALKAGHDRFVTRSGKVYSLDPAQECLILNEKDDPLLVGFPVKRHPRKRGGRNWYWLSIKGLEKA